MRSHVKKKVYAASVKLRAMDGFINNPDGNWHQNNNSVTEKAKTFSQAGAMGKSYRRNKTRPSK